MRQNPHVRICGGPGSATTLVYPTVEGCVSAVASAKAAPSGLGRAQLAEELHGGAFGRVAIVARRVAPSSGPRE